MGHPILANWHHQIRCQLAKMGCPIKGDLKYGFPRSNPDGSICLHARTVQFVHPVSKEIQKLADEELVEIIYEWQRL